MILALGAALLVSSIRRTADDAPTAAAAPAPSAEPARHEGPVATAEPWDATDTQSVDPVAFGSTTGTAIDPSDEAGSSDEAGTSPA